MRKRERERERRHQFISLLYLDFLHSFYSEDTKYISYIPLYVDDTREREGAVCLFLQKDYKLLADSTFMLLMI